MKIINYKIISILLNYILKLIIYSMNMIAKKQTKKNATMPKIIMNYKNITKKIMKIFK